MEKIKDIIAYLKNGHDPIEHTVDQLLFGHEEQMVSKIATTFNASIEVIEKAIQEGIQFIISHEGIYYTHRGIPEGLEQQPLYALKNKLIESNHIAVFRYHDYIHRSFPDPITASLVRQLKWHNETVEHQSYSAIVTLSTASDVQTIAAHIKEALQLPTIRLTGNMQQQVKRIGLLVGYRGGSANALPLIYDNNLDLLIVGEAQEWETAEYIVDCCAIGHKKAMLTIGHMASEAYGMKTLAQQLQAQFPKLVVSFLENDNCYKTL